MDLYAWKHQKETFVFNKKNKLRKEKDRKTDTITERLANEPAMLQQGGVREKKKRRQTDKRAHAQSEKEKNTETNRWTDTRCTPADTDADRHTDRSKSSPAKLQQGGMHTRLAVRSRVLRRLEHALGAIRILQE